MNTTDGGLHFEAGIDTNAWDQDISKIRKDAEQAMQEIQKQAGLLDDAFGKVSGGASGVEEALAKAGISFEQLVSGNMLENLKAANLEFGKTGAELRQAAKDADNFVTGMEEGLKAAIEQQKAALEAIAQMPEGEAKMAALSEFAEITKDIQSSTEVIGTFRQFISDVQEEAKSVSQRFSETRQEMERLVAAGEGSSARYKELAAEATRLKEAQTQVNKELSAMSEPPGLEGLISGMTFATATMGLAQGAMSMFGTENEKLNETMVRLQSLMSVTIGLQELQKQVTAEGALQINVISKAKEIWAVVNGRLAASLGVSTGAANAMMIAITGGLALAIIGIIYLFDQWADKQQKIAEQSQKLNGAIADSVAEPLLAYQNLQMQWNALADDLDAKKKFITDHKDEFEKLNVQVSSVSDAENVFVNNSTAFIQAMMLRAEATARAQIAIEDYKEALKAERDFQRKYVEGNMTAGEAFDFTLRAGPGKINARRALKEEAKDIQRKKQEAIDAQAVVYKLEQKAANIYKDSGFREPTTPGKAPKATKSGRSGAPRTKQQVADEYLPEGSLAEIQRRMQQIDKALSKATNGEQIEALKKKRIAAAAELAEAEKRVAVRSLEEQQEYMRKQYELRDQLLDQMMDPEQADRLFPEIKGKNYGDYLQATAAGLRALVDSGKGTEETAQGLMKVQQSLDEWLGNKSSTDLFKEKLEMLKKEFSGGELIAQIEKLKKNQVASEGAARQANNRLAQQAIEDEIKTQQDKFRQMLEEQKSYLEKSADLQKEYSAVKASEDYQNASPGDQAKIDEAFKKRFGTLDAEMIKSTAEWQVAFGEMEGMTNTSLQRILQRLLEFQQKSKGTLSIADAAELQKAIDRVQNAANRNPFAQLSATFGNYRKTMADSKKAQDDYNQALYQFGENSKQAREAGEQMVEADKKAVEAKKELVAKLQMGQEVFNAIGQGVNELADAFGGFDDATQDAIGNIMAIGNAAFDFAKSLASGDIAGMISAGLKLISSIAKALNGDQRKERNIKKQAAALKELETAYNNLAFAADRAFGSMKYEGQRDLIRNLEQQKAALQSLANTEGSKKKSDPEKISQYNSQIQQIGQSIISLKEGIIKDALQTDIPDMASKMGDALVDAFGRGEDAVDALNRSFDDMVRNMLRNQLNLILQNQMKGVKDKMLAAMGFDANGNGAFNGLTEAEIADIRAAYQQASQQGQEFLNAYAQIFKDLDPSSAQGLKGDIKGMTEKTGGALEAQINAMRVNQVSALEVSRNSLLNLIQIEFNTRYLIQISHDISEINSKTKKQLAGVP